MESSDDTSMNLIQDIFCVLRIENVMTVQNLNSLPGKTNVATVRSTAVFLNRRAAARYRYRALASIIPGRER
jgi:hypothetical protein